MRRAQLLGAAALVLAAGAGGFLAFRATHAPSLRAVATAPADGPTAPAASTAAAGKADAPIPGEVPALSMPDLAGHAQPLRADDGRPRLYNFWATWCAPCRKEIPLLNTLEGQYGSDGLRVVGVAIDSADAVRDYVKQRPIAYQVLVGEDEGVAAAQAFGVQMVLPFSVFADGSHRVVAVKLGELHADEVGAILGRMREVRAGTLQLEAARQAIADDLQALSVKRAQQTPKESHGS